MRALVVDDSILFRKVMADVLASLTDVEVVGQAANGRVALQKIQDLRPDVVTLDLEMPELDGIGVLEALRGVADPPAVIVVSAQSRHGGALTMQALSKGAFDFVTKPNSASAEESRAALRDELAPRIKALGMRFGVRDIFRAGAQPDRAAGATGRVPRPTAPVATRPAASSPADSPVAVVTTAPATGGPTPGGDVQVRMRRVAGTARPELLVIGVSTGGPNALAAVLPALPASLSVPVLVVQHMPPIFTLSLAENLDARCKLKVREAAHGEPLTAGTVYIAPGGSHMRIAAGQGGVKAIAITSDPPENNCRPAVDYLFRSAAEHYPGRTLAVILTGMGSDGARGAALLKSQGCRVLAQDEASCVVYGMPRAVVEAGVADDVLPLDALAGRIASLVSGGPA